MSKFMVFDPMDPLDNAIMADPEFESAVEDVENYVGHAANGDNSYICTEGAYEGIEDLDDMVDSYSDDGDMIDMPADSASEDAEDYGAAEMELLAGDFANNDAIDSLDDMGYEAVVQ